MCRSNVTGSTAPSGSAWVSGISGGMVPARTRAQYAPESGRRLPGTGPVVPGAASTNRKTCSAPVGALAGRLLGRTGAADDHELVPGEAPHGVGRPDALGEPVRHLHQDRVAHGVTEHVVDPLEPVDVDEQH